MHMHMCMYDLGEGPNLQDHLDIVVQVSPVR